MVSYQHNWLVVWTPLKNISQLGWLFPIYGKIKYVPNHQPDKRGVHPAFVDDVPRCSKDFPMSFPKCAPGPRRWTRRGVLSTWNVDLSTVDLRLFFYPCVHIIVSCCIHKTRERERDEPLIFVCKERTHEEKQRGREDFRHARVHSCNHCYIRPYHYDRECHENWEITGIICHCYSYRMPWISWFPESSAGFAWSRSDAVLGIQDLWRYIWSYPNSWMIYHGQIEHKMDDKMDVPRISSLVSLKWPDFVRRSGRRQETPQF